MTTSLFDNGVNVEALLGAREVFADAPQIAQFQWRSTVSWVNGTHSRADVQTFFRLRSAADAPEGVRLRQDDDRPEGSPLLSLGATAWHRRWQAR